VNLFDALGIACGTVPAISPVLPALIAAHLSGCRWPTRCIPSGPAVQLSSAGLPGNGGFVTIASEEARINNIFRNYV
jgi:hypothetical protein